MRAVLLLALGAGVTACSPQAPARPTTVTANEAVCDPIVSERLTTICFVTLASPETDTLVGVAASVGLRAELEEYWLENGMLVPYRMAGVPIAAGQPTRLHKDGPHLRLFGVTTPLNPGDEVDLTLSFATSGPVTVRARVSADPAA